MSEGIATGQESSIEDGALGLGSVQPYRYEKLRTASSIRLARLRDDASRPDDVCISLRTVDLTDKPRYSTLSYTWGNPRTTYRSNEEIPKTTGHERFMPVFTEDNGILLVTRNLFDFLLRWKYTLPGFARKHDPGLISWHEKAVTPEVIDRFSATPIDMWIDAICINQDDIEERNAQVVLMSKIYMSGHYVYAWLGENDSLTDKGIALAKRLSMIPLQRGTALREVDVDDRRWKSLLKADDDDFRGIYALFNREWFHRAWCVQEVVFGESILVLCGNSMFSFGVLKHAAHFIVESHLHTKIDFMVMREILEISDVMSTHNLQHDHTGRKLVSTKGGAIAATNIGRSIFHMCQLLDMRWGKAQRGFPTQILFEMRHKAASNPRDKIFACLGLEESLCATIQPRYPVKRPLPDYRKSVPAVFLEAAWYHILTYGRLSILAEVQDRSKVKVEGLASWVPDWSSVDHLESINFLPMIGDPGGNWDKKQWCAAGGLKWKLPTEVGSPKLHVQGWKIDVVAETATLGRKFGNAMAEFAVEGVLRCALSLPRVYPWAWGQTTLHNRNIEVPMAQSRVEVLWRVMMANSISGTYPAPIDFGYAFGDYLATDVAGEWVMNQQNGTDKQEVRNLYSKLLDSEPASRPVVQENEEWLENIGSGSAGQEIQNLFRQFADTEIYSQPKDQQSGSSKAPQQNPNEPFPPTGVGFLPPLPSEMNMVRRLIQAKVGSSTFNRFWERVTMVSAMRRVFRTENDFLGNGPRSIAKGDQVWILGGTFTPMILRPVKGNSYSFVGEAYVHGIMHGEALRFEGFTMSEIVLE